MSAGKMAPRIRLAALLWLAGLGLFLCSLFLPWKIIWGTIKLTGIDLMTCCPTFTFFVLGLPLIMFALFAAVVPFIILITGRDVLVFKRVGFGGSLLLGGGSAVVVIVMLYLFTLGGLTLAEGNGVYAACAGAAALIVGGLVARGTFGLAAEGEVPKKRPKRRLFGLAAPDADKEEGDGGKYSAG